MALYMSHGPSRALLDLPQAYLGKVWHTIGCDFDDDRFSFLNSHICGYRLGVYKLFLRFRTGTFVGDYNDTYPDVRQFKYIPYAKNTELRGLKPPVGPLRWASPERLDDSSEVIDSTTYGPSCAQYVSAIPAVWGLNITGNLIVNYGQSLFDGRAAQNSAEDCLSLAIWTPANASSGTNDDVKELLPVVIYLTGGGDQTGGVNIPTQLPSQWVHRSQRHIVVTTNYRVNIFGNPHARGLDGNGNFGRQDQRAAVEWVAENIAAFGGDPARMTLWGQSAGAIAADEYLFAFPDDPLVRAAITSSGSALISSFGSRDHEGANFTFVAKSLGCDFGNDATDATKKKELQCMRRIPFQRITNFVGQYQDNSTLVDPSQPPLTFSSQPDEKWVFANYTQRYVDGKVAKIPSIIGTTAREGSALAYVPLSNYTEGPSEETVVKGTLRFVCPSHESSVARDDLGLATYRYHWAGDFANLGPVSWLGAYHYSDLYMVFGSYGIAPGEISPLEVETSETMQDYFLDFVTDPESLAGKGWPQYHASASEGGTVAQFGAHGKAVELVTGDSVEGACHIPGVEYNTRP
ncbi:carboxylesterase [Apiospora rasikravindrae]|uniref:Carboxylic ester hydrolase n=1 Tax=Apiospora rasikravindrae TaxID=990691 RepID=A0ABR1TF88_9PEZI